MAHPRFPAGSGNTNLVGYQLLMHLRSEQFACQNRSPLDQPVASYGVIYVTIQVVGSYWQMYDLAATPDLLFRQCCFVVVVSSFVTQ